MEQVQPRTMPELIDDVIWQILVRIPPDESAYLAGASLVCKLWRRIISDPGFARRYRELHRTPPLLGFLHNTESGLSFFPTPAACPFPQPAFDFRRRWALDYRRLGALDCRHGRVLLRQSHKRNLLVWDPITGDQKELPNPPHIPLLLYSAMVLCAVAGCDHGDCIGGPFLVVLVASCSSGSARGCVYSSEARAWGTPASLHLGNGHLVNVKRPALIGDDAYFITCHDNAKILRYNLDKNRFSAIDLPDGYSSWTVDVMPTDDGWLGLACIRDSNLCLWSREVNPMGGVARWVQRRVIQLEKLPSINISCKRASVVGFAEGAGVIFVTINTSTFFMIELKSGRVRELSEVAGFFRFLPFMSFYNPGSASNVLPLPAERK
ncbi:unnamed protein product [Urochloa decumbens]|uniref:F-box domain-containing protein n=1 Tax=Urochloa decumbens TaxID=240449 RepID=A0ABC9AG96_9POAL